MTKYTSTITIMNNAKPKKPLFFVCFNQKIDPEEVLKVIKFTYKSTLMSKSISAQISKSKNDAVINQFINSKEKGKWLIFEPKERLPFDTEYNLEIGPKIPSAEGNLLSSQKNSTQYRTLSPFKVLSYSPVTNTQIAPRENLTITFSHPMTQFNSGDVQKDLTGAPKISPKKEGKWISRSTHPTSVIFLPDADWNKSTEYIIKVENIESNYHEELSES